jgi:hypothetical protein
MKRTGSVALPCASQCSPLSLSRRQVPDWRAKDPEFRRRFAFAREMALETSRIADQPPPDGLASRKWLAKQRLRVKTRFWLMSRWFLCS